MFDYRAFKEFENSFDNATGRFNTWLRTFMLQQGHKFITEVKLRTPVDTGDLRGHWDLDPEMPFERTANEVRVWFINSMEYASYVEYGHAKPYKSGAAPGSPDWVEGKFMMTITLDDIYAELPAEFNAEFTTFLATMGVR